MENRSPGASGTPQSPDMSGDAAAINFPAPPAENPDVATEDVEMMDAEGGIEPTQDPEPAAAGISASAGEMTTEDASGAELATSNLEPIRARDGVTPPNVARNDAPEFATPTQPSRDLRNILRAAQQSSSNALLLQDPVPPSPIIEPGVLHELGDIHTPDRRRSSAVGGIAGLEELRNRMETEGEMEVEQQPNGFDQLIQATKIEGADVPVIDAFLRLDFEDGNVYYVKHPSVGFGRGDGAASSVYSHLGPDGSTIIETGPRGFGAATAPGMSSMKREKKKRKKKKKYEIGHRKSKSTTSGASSGTPDPSQQLIGFQQSTQFRHPYGFDPSDDAEEPIIHLPLANPSDGNISAPPKKNISRRHARLFYNPRRRRFEFEILGKNGAWIDDEFVGTGTNIIVGDEGLKVQIGGVTFRIVVPARLLESGDHGGKMSFSFHDEHGNEIKTDHSAAEDVAMLDGDGGLDSEGAGSGDDDSGEQSDEEDADEEADSDEDSDEDDDNDDEEEDIEDSPSPEPIVEKRGRGRPKKSGVERERKAQATLKEKERLLEVERKKKLREKEKAEALRKEKEKREREKAKLKEQELAKMRKRNAELAKQKEREQKLKEKEERRLQKEKEKERKKLVLPEKKESKLYLPMAGNKPEIEQPRLLPQPIIEEPGPEPMQLVGGPTHQHPHLQQHAQSYGAIDPALYASEASASPVTPITPGFEKPKKQKAPTVKKRERSPSPDIKESDYTPEQLLKPNLSYVVMCHEAILNSEEKALSLPQIYKAIERKYPYYKFKVSTTGWQSSVRHNLGQNKAFRKVERAGKGWLWGVVEGVSIEKEKKTNMPKQQPMPMSMPLYGMPVSNGQPMMHPQHLPHGMPVGQLPPGYSQHPGFQTANGVIPHPLQGQPHSIGMPHHIMPAHQPQTPHAVSAPPPPPSYMPAARPQVSQPAAPQPNSRAMEAPIPVISAQPPTQQPSAKIDPTSQRTLALLNKLVNAQTHPQNPVVNSCVLEIKGLITKIETGAIDTQNALVQVGALIKRIKEATPQAAAGVAQSPPAEVPKPPTPAAGHSASPPAAQASPPPTVPFATTAPQTTSVEPPSAQGQTAGKAPAKGPAKLTAANFQENIKTMSQADRAALAKRLIAMKQKQAAAAGKSPSPSTPIPAGKAPVPAGKAPVAAGKMPMKGQDIGAALSKISPEVLQRLLEAKQSQGSKRPATEPAGGEPAVKRVDVGGTE